jgi:hypothetical protein
MHKWEKKQISCAGSRNTGTRPGPPEPERIQEWVVRPPELGQSSDPPHFPLFSGRFLPLPLQAHLLLIEEVEVLRDPGTFQS